jgi:DDE superfamily endonuclease/Helix-turn-helix of DDE superfamily endonuclease
MNIKAMTTFPKDKVRALVGLTPAALGDLLLAALPEIDRRRRQEQADKPKRKRKVGGGRKRLLQPYQEILLTLIYLRHNVAFCVVGLMFGVSADVAENTFHEIVGVLKDVCPANRYEAEKRWTKKEPSWKPEEIDKVIVDSFETPVPRPSIEPKQTHLYSGKKKDHTLKTEIITNIEGDILDIDPGYRGPKSDKKLHEGSEVAKQFPNATVIADLAYKGLKGGEVPHKKPRGGELTPEQKEENRVFSSVRVRVEHSIRRVKAFRIVRDEYRLATGLFARNCSCVVGLVQLLSLSAEPSSV